MVLLSVSTLAYCMISSKASYQGSKKSFGLRKIWMVILGPTGLFDVLLTSKVSRVASVSSGTERVSYVAGVSSRSETLACVAGVSSGSERVSGVFKRLGKGRVR